jgi:hypothetical protein
MSCQHLDQVAARETRGENPHPKTIFRNPDPLPSHGRSPRHVSLPMLPVDHLTVEPQLTQLYI